MTLDWTKYGIQEKHEVTSIESGQLFRLWIRFRNEAGLLQFIADNLRYLSSYTVQWNVDFEPILTIKPKQ